MSESRTNPILEIDPEFEAKCPPLTQEEYQQLEENILEEGLVLMPLIIWNNTIVDGHNRYKIAQAHPGIEFHTHEKVFDSRYAAISWICKNQLGRRNLTPLQKKYLIGQRYKAEKNAHGGDRKSETAKSSSQNGNLIPAQKTCERIAEENKTSKNYVIRAESYSDGVDAAEEVLPGIKDELLLGKVKPKETDVAAIARTSPEKRLEKARQLRTAKDKPPGGNKPTATRRRQDYQQIDKIYADMKNPCKKVSEDDVLETMRSAVRTMIRVCDTLFEDFPRLLTAPPYRAKVVEIMQEPKAYIQKLEGDAK